MSGHVDVTGRGGAPAVVAGTVVLTGREGGHDDQDLALLDVIGVLDVVDRDELSDVMSNWSAMLDNESPRWMM